METDSPSDLSSLAPELQKRVRDELEPDERVIWIGQPIPKLAMRASIPFVLFGSIWTVITICCLLVFSFSWSNDKWEGSGENVLSLFMVLIFLTIGFCFLSSPFWLYRRAFKTIYLLTNQRTVVWKPEFLIGCEVRSLRPRDFGFVHRRDFGDGTGDLVLQEFFASYGKNIGEVSPEWKRQGFLAIANVKAVEDLVRKTLLEKSESPVRIE